MDLQGKKVVVVGLAQTGISVAKFCASRGANVIVTDGKKADDIPGRVAQVKDIATLELGGHNLDSFTSADVVVMSPGVPDLKETKAARAAGVPVIAEIELAYRFFVPGATLIAITGTNGKSTTTALTGALCEASGRPTFCGGNLGNHPLIEAVDHPANSDGGLIVAEVAGFMLETCTSFRPDIGACLNITEDHLERFGTMEVYASMKTRIYEWQTSEDVAIANELCPLTMAGARGGRGDLFVFNSQARVDKGACLDRDTHEIVLRLGGAEERYPWADLNLIGSHNLENAMAAYIAARKAGVEAAAIRKGAQAFVPQKHRMEKVAVIDGVTYYDDSKGTNVAAVAASMTGFPMPVVLIAGGVDKGGSYQPMFEALAPVCTGLVLIGEAKGVIREAAKLAGATYPVVDADDMDNAVRRAADLAQAGQAVVLSPACSSYDMFRNFEERGRAFRGSVNGLKGE
jgi:UDP-N-acetylmuramoylalanine--D-glutamate ligase